MKTFIKNHKTICITLSIILILLLSALIWFQMHVGFRNLPLTKISGTIESIIPPDDSSQHTKLYIKLDDPSSWPECEYAYVNCTIKNIKEGDQIYIFCSSAMNDSDPPGLSAYFMWKK